MSCQTSTTTKRRAGCFHTSLNTETHKIISPFPLQYQVDERYAPEYPPIWAVVSSRPNGGLLQAVNNSLSRQKSQMERPPSSLHAFTLLVMPLCVTTGVTRPEEGHGFGCCVTKIFGRHEFSGSWNVKNQLWTKWTVSMSRRKLPRCRKIAVNFDFTISVNYGYVYDFENVKRIIWSHELQKTTKFALLKAPKYFGRKCKLQS